jgi:hypothetical protein
MQMNVLLIALILQVSGGKSATGFFIWAPRARTMRAEFLLYHTSGSFVN